MSTLKGRLKRVSVRARNMLAPARDPGTSAVGPRSSSFGMLGSLLDDRALERELRRDGGSGDAIFQDKFGGRARQLLARVRSVPLAARDLGGAVHHRAADHVAAHTHLTLLVITVGARAAPPAVHLHAVVVSRDTLQFEIEWSVALRELRRIAWPVRSNALAAPESLEATFGPLMTLEFRADGKESPARVFGLELLPQLHSSRSSAGVGADAAGSLSRQQCVWSILRLLRYEPALALAHTKEKVTPALNTRVKPLSSGTASAVSATGGDDISMRSACSNSDSDLSAGTDEDEGKDRARDTAGANLLFGGVALDGIDLIALQGAVGGSRFAQKLNSSIAAMCNEELPPSKESQGVADAQTKSQGSNTPDAAAATAPAEAAGLELDLLNSASGIGSALGTGLLSSTGVPLSQSDVTAVEELLNSREWRRARVGELEESLMERAEHLEAQNLELLLRWGEGNADRDGEGDSSNAGGAGHSSDDEGGENVEGHGTASVRELVEELDAVDAELEALQARLEAHAPMLEDVRRDVTRLEGANNRLELEKRNATELLHKLHELLAKLQLDSATLSLLSDPASSLADAGRAHNSLGAGARGQTKVVEASQALGRAIRAASDPSLKLGASTLLACRERAAELAPRAQKFGQSLCDYMRRRFEVVVSTRGLRNACGGEGGESAASSPRSSTASMWTGIDGDSEIGGEQQAPSAGRVARPRFSFSDVQLPSGSQRLKSVPLDSYMFHNDLRWEQPLMIALSELDDALALDSGPAFDSSASSTSDTGRPINRVGSNDNKDTTAAACSALVGGIVAVYEEVAGVMYANDIDAWFGELSTATVSAARGIRLNALPSATIHSVQKELLAVSAQHKRSCATLTAAVAMRAALAQLVPLMLREAAFVREFFSLSRQPGTMARVLGALFGNLEKYFSKLIDSAADDPAGMLSALLECKQLLRRGSECCWPPPLIAFLAELCAQLSARFERYVDEQCAWIAGRTVDTRQAGVLPVVLRMPSLIDRLDIVGQHFCQQVGVDNTATRGGRAAVEVNPDDPLETISNAQAKLVGALFKWLEKTASSKPKYREIVRMENYFFFCETVGARRLSTLVGFVEQAREAFAGAMGRYCEWVLNGQFSRLIGFFERLKEHFGSMPANEVQFYIKRAEFDSMRAQNALDMDKSLRKLRERIAKHLCAEAGLLGVVWDKTMDDFISMYSEFEALAERCYEGSDKLSPSSSDLRAMATALSQDGADAAVPAAVAAITAVAAHDDSRR